MNKTYLSSGLLFFVLSQSPLRAETEPKQLPDPASVQAYEQFWSTFEDYDAQHRALEQGKFFGAWDQVRHEWNYREQRQREQQIDLLQEGARRYKQHLISTPDAGNAPYVKLNLAQILNKIGQLEDEKSSGAGRESKREALALLASLEQENPGFSLSEETRYLRASILESLDQAESALTIWKSLAAQAKSSLYGVHASIAVGDHAFAKERPAEALKAYRQAADLLGRISTPDKDFETLRLHYRIAWAAYRAADLDLCVQTSQLLLEPGREFRQLSVKRRVERDAAELLGDALFELDDMKKSKAVLQKNMIRPYAGAIGFKLMSRLVSMPTKNRLIEIGQFMVENYPQAREMPEILTLLGSAYKEENRTEDHLATLERLALMLPSASLWRNQHKSDPDVLKNMETKALAANGTLAAHYYEQGVTQNNGPSFKSASSYYETLLKFDPQHPEAENWQLRRAHCFYFGAQWQKADQAYEEFKAQKVSTDKLEIAFYQQALAREKLWRESLQKTIGDRGEPQKNPLVVERLRNFENVVDAFADRFPNRPHSNDLLLLVASANRDMTNFKQAERYWNRTLLSEPNPAQRTLAIRGLIQAKIRSESSREVFKLTENYLKLENWQELGATFREELLGILSTSVRESSEDLNKNGHVRDAGRLLVETSREFPDLPDRDTIYRDGAYLLAIAGDWQGSSQAAEVYLGGSSRQREADMTYLKARSLEYQLRFAEAAATHLDLAERFPAYAKSAESVRRAEDLALAEDDPAMAGRAALAASSFAKTDTAKLAAERRAAQHYLAAKEWNKSLDALQKAKRHARRQVDLLPLQLEIARVYTAKSDLKQARPLYQEIVESAAQKQEDLDQDIYRRVAGEAAFQLGEAERLEFEDFELQSGLSSLANRIQEKSEKLEKSLKHFNRAIQTRDPEWSSRARYGAGQLAEQMAQQMKTALAKNGDDLSAGESKTFGEQADRWQKLAQEYFSQNILARHREPHRYKDSVWMERSALRVSGLGNKEKAHIDSEVPAALGPSQPFQWSH